MHWLIARSNGSRSFESAPGPARQRRMQRRRHPRRKDIGAFGKARRSRQGLAPHARAGKMQIRRQPRQACGAQARLSFTGDGIAKTQPPAHQSDRLLPRRRFAPLASKRRAVLNVGRRKLAGA